LKIDPEHAELIRMGFPEGMMNSFSTLLLLARGLEMIATQPYDLISVDWFLPGIGGLDVLVEDP